MTQDNYTLWTGEDASRYSDEEWEKIVNVAEGRLASFLCLPDGLPKDEDGNLCADIELILASFIAGTLANQGSTGPVASKSVRNFTISFKTASASDAFALIAEKYSDIIEKYSKCDVINVEQTARYCCEDI